MKPTIIIAADTTSEKQRFNFTSLLQNCSEQKK
jgi:hypothetical protein